MFKTIIWIIYFCGYMIYTLIPLAKVKKLNKISSIEDRDLLIGETSVNWAKDIVSFSGSTIKVTGNEYIPKDGGVLFVCNHQSLMDIPVLIGYLSRTKGFIAKSELKKAPILSQWMSIMNCVFIHRGDARQSLQDINMGIDILKRGNAIVLFPEGTRSSDGLVQEFKPGSLRLGLKSKVPIIPVTIKGTRNIMPKDKLTISSATVEVIVAPPIVVDEGEKDSNKISEMVREIIIQNLK